MKVFIANFGQQNYLWPKCLARATVATMDDLDVHPFWLARDRQGYIEYSIAHKKTVRGEFPTRPVASRWFGLADVIGSTADDIWIHREKEQLWWTTSKPGELIIEEHPSFDPARHGPTVFELHKPAEPWTDRNRRGGPLSWGGLHPKAKEFLFTEGTLQQLSEDNAAYALALIDGDDLSPWHNSRPWQAKAERTRRSPGVTFNPRQKAVAIMAMTARDTVAGANGQQVTRTMKNKELRFHPQDFERHIDNLIEAQEGLCAITGIKLQFHGDEDDKELLCSLDRIDSDGHYEAGNLQIVCRFTNRWKNNGRDEDFRRLIGLVRSSAF